MDYELNWKTAPANTSDIQVRDEYFSIHNRNNICENLVCIGEITDACNILVVKCEGKQILKPELEILI